MILFKRIFWLLWLSPDWFLVVLDNGAIQPLFWNGKYWNTRMERVPCGRVRRIASRIPAGNPFIVEV